MSPTERELFSAALQGTHWVVEPISPRPGMRHAERVRPLIPAGDRPFTFLDSMVMYLVDTPTRSIGVVDGWETDGSGQPRALVVGRGWSRRHTLQIPVEALIGVIHPSRRIVVDDGAVPPTRRGLLDIVSGLGRGERAAIPSSHSRSAAGTSPVMCVIGTEGADDSRAAVLSVAAGLARKLGVPLVLTPDVSENPSTTVPAPAPGPTDHFALAARVDTVALTMLSPLVAGTDVRRQASREQAATSPERAADSADAQLLVVRAPRAEPGACPSPRHTGGSGCPVVLVPV